MDNDIQKILVSEDELRAKVKELGATVLVGIYDSLSLTGSMLGFALPQWLQDAHAAIPLAGQGFAWVIPAIAGMAIGGLIWSATGRTRTPARNLPDPG